MKTLKESILSDMETTIESGDRTIINIIIQKFLSENYKFDILKKQPKPTDYNISSKPNKDGKYEVSTRKIIKLNEDASSITNNLFVFTTSGHFSCVNCNKLKSLEGAPRVVDGEFNCSGCINLESLEGAPDTVHNFNCSNCINLKSLKGAPKTVKEGFYCSNCINLESLEGAPKKLKYDFMCNNCSKLKSLKEAPREVGEIFNCKNCGVKFTVDDVTQVCDISREEIIII